MFGFLVDSPVPSYSKHANIVAAKASASLQGTRPPGTKEPLQPISISMNSRDGLDSNGSNTVLCSGGGGSNGASAGANGNAGSIAGGLVPCADKLYIGQLPLNISKRDLEGFFISDFRIIWNFWFDS